MSKIVKLYQASIPYGVNGLKIYEAEFTETDKQFKRTSDHPFIIPKNSRDGSPGNGYARTPEQAIANLRLSLERQLDRLRGEMADVQERLNIVSEARAPRLPGLRPELDEGMEG